MKSNQYKILKSTRGIFIHIFLLITAIFCLFPLFWMVRSSFMSLGAIFTDKSFIPTQIHLDNYVRAWVDGNFAGYLLNSIIYTVVVVFGIIVVSSLAAYAFSRFKFPGKTVFFYMFLAAMMIPLPGGFVPLYVLMTKLGLIDTRIGYILCMINVGLSMSIFILKTFFDKLPTDLEDIARIDGCGRLQILWYVALPLAKPAIAVIIIFNSLNVWNEFILAQLLLNESHLMPLQVGLMKFQGANIVDYPVLMAGLTIAVVPIILIYLAMQKHIVKGLTLGATVG
ncbi:MAG: raffinose/stachyose/melibiose transport system permease protein [Candidatus Omnitrophota bacterium]|jgi:raffinose/stachyose/melibiose transport system permease protein